MTEGGRTAWNFAKRPGLTLRPYAAFTILPSAALRRPAFPQWQEGTYPDAATVEGDIAQGIGYVLCDGGEVVGAVALTTQGEEGYRHIFDGAWLTPLDGPYVTVHRIAVSGEHRGKGLSKRIMQEAEALAAQRGFPSVRVDTHEQNAVMRSLLSGLGYRQCGTIILLDGDEKGAPRLCYEKLI